jgi:cell division protein FtsB
VPALLQERQHQLIIWSGVSFFLILTLLAVVGERGFLDAHEFARHLERVERQIDVLEAENALLREQVIGLRHDPHQVEKLAREELGLVRPDEIVFIVVGTQSAP